MPNERFFNLNDTKKEAIITAFLKEFSAHTFEEASITSVVKSLGISKGSIYQYFEDKLDLLLFLKGKCEETKMAYVIHLDRKGYPDFWSYFRCIYIEGIKFDLENPLKSKLLYNIYKSQHSPALQNIFASWKLQSLNFLEAMIQVEVDQGHFRADVPIKTMAHFLYSITSSLGDYMEDIHSVKFNKDLKTGQALSTDKEEVLMKSIDEIILLLQKAFNL